MLKYINKSANASVLSNLELSLLAKFFFLNIVPIDNFYTYYDAKLPISSLSSSLLMMIKVLGREQIIVITKKAMIMLFVKE